MMTAEQFQSRYHAFRTPSREEALSKLAEVACEEPVVAVRIGLEYCLMLARAAEALSALGIAAEVVEA